MKKRLLALALAIVMVSGVISQVNDTKVQAAEDVMAEIYVSPTGSAEGDGSEGRPLQTMEQAKNKVRTMNQDMSGDIVVYFDDGEYHVGSAIEFNQVDSGSNSNNIIYKAKQGCKPVFTSEEKITGWTDAGDPQREGLLKASAPNVNKTRQFYVNGTLAIRARGQIDGSIERTGDYEEYTTYNGTHKAYRGYKSNAKDMLNWRNIQDIEFVYDIMWAHRIVPVESITAQGNNEIYIKMHWEPFRLSQFAGGTQVHIDKPSYIENAYELLDEPGEWYFDEAEKTIYYMPKEDEDMNSIEAIIPTTEQFVTIHGDVDNKVKNIVFEGLSFRYNSWLYPSDNGWVDQQANFAHDPQETANMHGYSLAPLSAIETKMSENITISGCSFWNIGSGAISILEGSQGNVVEQCVFKDISAGGVLIGGVNIIDAHPVALNENASLEEVKQAIAEHAEDPAAHPHDERLIVKDNVVTNCYFNEIGTEYKGSIAIVAGYTDGTVITHNTIKNVAYSGISVGWGWGFWDQTGRAQSVEAGEITPEWYPIFPEGDATVSRNNIIEYNDVGFCMSKMHDGGGIYTLGDMPGSSISFNSLHDMNSWPGGVYLDEGSGGIVVEGNITYNTPMTYFYNIREFTWGHRMNPPVFKVNYWNVSPSSPRYPTELAQQIGIQKEYRDMLPKVLERVTAPDTIRAGDKVTLEGYFGEESGKVIMTGESQPVTVAADSRNMISWSADKIVFLIPGGVMSGAIYVECADGTATNADKMLTILGREREIFSDDFESYEIGKLKDQASAAEKYTFLHDRITVAEEDGSKILKMTSNGSDTYLTKEENWEDVQISFDFRFDTATEGYGGIYISPRYQDLQNRYLTNLLPTFSNGIFCQKYINGEYSQPADIAMQYEVGTWYQIKLEMIEQNLKIKLWKRGEVEPTSWTGNVAYSGLTNGGFFLQYVNSLGGENVAFASFDNLSVKIFEDGITKFGDEDDVAPVTTASIEGEKTEDETYINQVSVTLDSEDEGSGVSEIVYQINGGKTRDYEKPIIISKNGDFEITYFAYDRAGNKEDVKMIAGKIEQGKVIFEDDFESYQEGALTGYEDKGYVLTDADKVFVEKRGQNEDGNVLKIQGKQGNDVRLTKPETWNDTIMTLDFKYQDLSGYEGLYVSNYYQSHTSPSNYHVYPIVPASAGIFLQENVNGNTRNVTSLSTGEAGLAADNWYHLKVRTSENQMAVKVWPMDGTEPEGWMAQSEVTRLSGGGGLHLSFASGTKPDNYILCDNIKIISFEEKEKTNPGEEDSDKSYTVTFQDGNTILEKQTIEKDKNASEPKEPTKTGYTFQGWYTDRTGGTKVTFPYMVTKDVILHARWSVKQYKITFDVNGGKTNSAITNASKNYNYDSIVALPTSPSRTGFEFLGWYTAKTGGVKVTSIKVADKDTIFYAQWKARVYSVKFDSQGGRAVSNRSANYNGTVGKLPSTTRTGYTFKGWYTTKSKGTKITASRKVTQNVTFYVRWSVAKPAKPQSLNVSNTTKNKVALTWKRVSSATGYEIQRSTKRNSGYRTVKTVTKGTTVKYTDTKLKANTTYYYRIRAINRRGSTTNRSAYVNFKAARTKK